MHLPRFFLLAPLCACLLPALAQEQTAAPGDTASQDMQQVVDVQSTRDPDLRPYRTMLKGLDAYADHQRLAPGAPLRFMLVPATPQARLDGVTLHLSADNLSIPVPLAADGGFTLTRDKTAYDANADLVSNKKRDTLRWRADIHTPGLPANVRRLGDLRLKRQSADSYGLQMLYDQLVNEIKHHRDMLQLDSFDAEKSSLVYTQAWRRFMAGDALDYQTHRHTNSSSRPSLL